MNGIINLRKEAGMTSHDAVFRLRKILQTKKIGHGGTLDPDVVGVLPIAVGKATRLVEFMQEEGKTYEGEITLGFSTTTEDASGERVESTPVEELVEESLIDEAMQSMTGQLRQIPPMYSAVKVKGRKLYEYARSGQEVERPERLVTIYSFERTGPLAYEEEAVRFPFRVRCSKGTYIRTLSVDLGARLGYASHMSQLTRTAAAGMRLEKALTLAQIEELAAAEDFSFLQPLELGIGDLTKVQLTEEQIQDVKNGRFISLLSDEVQLAGFDGEKLAAILEKRDEMYKPRKVFL
ncbi:tRNA pseudouridine synthase B [Streptococcus sp. DD11]|uniref:tRNA pseudouridine(55) synthase TruB n=1 Tax=Streptococcus sp. DD11 TaxID=1777879 RepID=UPI0007938509|nr:tRNA pseudouridine(55) synthase TruB [Streptococcus sp. DD11]KXT79639.1 tRNA pseudouridine synthase B [Streptococcus sp. DD11]